MNEFPEKQSSLLERQNKLVELQGNLLIIHKDCDTMNVIGSEWDTWEKPETPETE